MIASKNQWPRAAKKGEVFKRLQIFNVLEVRHVINEIIAKKRNLPHKIARNVRTLRRDEVEEILNYFSEL